MQKIVIVANGAAYGSESLFNSLRLAIALREQEGEYHFIEKPSLKVAKKVKQYVTIPQ